MQARHARGAAPRPHPARQTHRAQDPSVFSAPLVYDLARSNKELRKHAGFGVGAHRCPGWRLGVLEACEAVQAVLRACPRLRLAVRRSELRWRELDSLNCLEALPVKGWRERTV